MSHKNCCLCDLHYYCTVHSPNDPNIHLVSSTSSSHGSYHLSDNQNTYYVAIDSNNNIIVLLDSDLTTVS